MNIQKNELRIGNHLEYYIGEEGVEWDTTKLDWQDLRWCELDNETFNKSHRPIDLTVEMFLQSRFKKDKKEYFWIDLQTHRLGLIPTNDGFIPAYVQYPELSCEIEQIIHLKRIKYVHELENLYFVLQGEEINLGL